MRHLWTSCALAALAMVATTGIAGAAHEPTFAQRKIVVRTVHDSRLTAVVDDDRYDVRHVVLSDVRTPGRLYDRIALVPHDDRLDGALGIVRRLHGHWRLIELGTAEVGCRLPRAVRRDLRIVCG
jgi:hypothetical protein